MRNCVVQQTIPIVCDCTKWVDDCPCREWDHLVKRLLLLAALVARSLLLLLVLLVRLLLLPEVYRELLNLCRHSPPWAIARIDRKKERELWIVSSLIDLIVFCIVKTFLESNEIWISNFKAARFVGCFDIIVLGLAIVSSFLLVGGFDNWRYFKPMNIE